MRMQARHTKLKAKMDRRAQQNQRASVFDLFADMHRVFSDMVLSRIGRFRGHLIDFL